LAEYLSVEGCRLGLSRLGGNNAQAKEERFVKSGTGRREPHASEGGKEKTAKEIADGRKRLGSPRDVPEGGLLNRRTTCHKVEARATRDLHDKYWNAYKEKESCRAAPRGKPRHGSVSQ